MGSKTTKTVKVPESQAREWDQYVEETPEVDSVSHLIRLSVQKEISGDYSIERRHTEGDESTGVGVSGEVLTSLRKIETAIDDVEERITALEGVQSAEAGYDLQRAAYTVLSAAPDSAIVPGGEGGEEGYVYEDADFEEWADTPESVANQLGADIEDIADTLEDLHNIMGGEVRQVHDEDSDTVYYFKRGK